MSTLPTVESSVVSIFHSLSFLDSLHFSRSENRVAAAVLADPASFEGRHIRDAEEHGRGLFRVTVDAEYDGSNGKKQPASVAATLDGVVDKDRLRRSILGRSTNTRNNANNRDASWTFAKRRGPERIPKPETATPLKRRRPNATGNKGDNNNKDGEDSEAYLIAAKKLLEHYSGSGTSMTRAQEHVELLSSQYEGLMESIADLQEELEKPQPKQAPSPNTEGIASNTSSGDLEALEAEIRREELEIFALKELKAEVDKEARNLAEALEARQPSAKPLPKQNRFRQPVPSTSDTASIATSSKPSTKSSGSGPPKKEPSAVARKIAEAREKMAASRRTPDSVTASVDSLNEPIPASPSAALESENPTLEEDVTKGEAIPPASAEPEKQQAKPEPAIPAAQLEAIITKIVSTMPSSTKQPQDAHQVLAQLAALLSSNPNEQNTLTPVQTLEYHLLHTYLTLLLSLPPIKPNSSPLTLIFRTPATSTTQKPEPMLSLNAIKTSLAEYAKGKDWNEDLGTKAVYGLVAKRIVKIDRSGRESLVGFTL